LAPTTTAAAGHNDALNRAIVGRRGKQADDAPGNLPLFGTEYPERWISPLLISPIIVVAPRPVLSPLPCFLSRFTKAYPWAHLDSLAPRGFSGGKDRVQRQEPATLLTQYLLNQVGLIADGCKRQAAGTSGSPEAAATGFHLGACHYLAA